MVEGRRSRLRWGLAVAGAHLILRVPLISFGLPFVLNPDEPYILKDPFKLLWSNLHGSFPTISYLFNWVILAWFGLVHAVGSVLGFWRGTEGLREMLALETALIPLGRTLSLLLASGAVFVLAWTISQHVSRRWVRFVFAGLLVVNPIDVVATAWLKFDGMVGLTNAVLIWAVLRDVVWPSDRTRRLTWCLAIVACSVRPDFIATVGALLIADLVRGRSLRPLGRPLLVGGVLYCVITGLPMVVAQGIFGSGAAAGPMVGESFEENILNAYLSTVPQWPRFFRDNLIGYLKLLTALGVIAPLALVAARKNPAARVLVFLAVTRMAPLLLSYYRAPRYLFPTSQYLIVAAALLLGTFASRRVGQVMAIGSLVWSLVLSIRFISTVDAFRSDPRLMAGRYLWENSHPTDLIAIDQYQNPGFHAELDECPDELREKARAVAAIGRGTGEHYRLKAERDKSACRRIIELALEDAFANSPWQGRWTRPYADLERDLIQPKLVASTEPDKVIPEAAKAMLKAIYNGRYEFAREFTWGIKDRPLRWLVDNSSYDATIYVFRRIEGSADVRRPAP